MSTTPKTEEEEAREEEDNRVTVYVYIADADARHPVNPDSKQMRARAVSSTGSEKAEFYATTIPGVKKLASEYDWGDHVRLVFVPDPEDHPILSKLLDDAEDAAEDVQRELERESGARPLYEPGDLQVMRTQHHICGDCQIAEICALASHPAFEANTITVTGCAQYRPPEEAKDAIHRPKQTT